MKIVVLVDSATTTIRRDVYVYSAGSPLREVIEITINLGGSKEAHYNFDDHSTVPSLITISNGANIADTHAMLEYGYSLDKYVVERIHALAAYEDAADLAIYVVGSRKIFMIKRGRSGTRPPSNTIWLDATSGLVNSRPDSTDEFAISRAKSVHEARCICIICRS